MSGERHVHRTVRTQIARLGASLCLILSLGAIEIIHATPSIAAVCLSGTLTPFADANKKVTYSFRGECATDVKGIRVHLNGWRKNLDSTNKVKIVDDATRTCGGPTSPTIIDRCPQIAFWAEVSGNRASGCKYYWAHVWIDVVYGGQAFWSLNQDNRNSGNALICYSDPP